MKRLRRSARWAILGLASLALAATVDLARPPASCAQPAGGPCATRSVILQDAVAANGNGTDAHVAGFAFLGVQIYHPTAGATPGFTVNFEQSINGSHYVGTFCQHVAAAILHNTATVAGLWRCNVTGARVFRSRISTYSGSGSISVLGLASTCGEP